MKELYTTCVRCQHKNRFFAQFCSQCGAKMPMPLITAQHHRLIRNLMITITLLVMAEAAIILALFSQ